MRTRDKVSKILRDVSDNDAEYTFVRNGEPVAVLIPVERFRALHGDLETLS